MILATHHMASMHLRRLMGFWTTSAALVAAVFLHQAAAGAAEPPAVAEIKLPGHIAGGASVKLAVKEQPADVLPKAANPYEGKAYAGCEGGFCPAEDPALERDFFLAAYQGKAKAIKKLLTNDKLNITRNIVPDSEGLTRVIDVAMWAAAYKGHYDAMKVSRMAQLPVSIGSSSSSSIDQELEVHSAKCTVVIASKASCN